VTVHVLHLINGEFYAGAERVQDLLAMRLPDFGFECGFACLKPKAFDANRRAKLVPLYDVQMRSRFDASVVARVAEVITRGGYEVLHTHTVRGGLIGRFAARKAGVPMVHHIHSPARRETEQGLRNKINAFVEERVGLPAAVRVCTVSDSLRTYLIELGVPEAPIRVIPNGVPVLSDTADWKPPSGDWILGTVALFRPRKGLEVLLRALHQIRQTRPDVRLLAVGGFETQDYEREMRQLATELGLDDAIEWTGFTREVGQQLRRMNAFVLPSLFGEGLPMVMIEAMAAGLPVVASRVEGIPEVIGVGGAGIVVEPADVASLAAGLMRIVGGAPEDVRRIALAGHARQRDRYSDVAMARAMAGLYTEVLSGQTRAVAAAF
jgi:glycosyltransferase involved in cell wall biosynthesis